MRTPQDAKGASLQSGMDAIVKEFLAESAENLDQLDQDFVQLEKNPEDREVFSRIFRTIHTIKGTCGFLAFGKLEEVTHSGENVLSYLRDGYLKLTPELTTTLLSMIDAVREILGRIESAGSEGDGDYSGLVADLQRLDAEAEKKKKLKTRPDAPAEPEPTTAAPGRIELDLEVEDETPAGDAAEKPTPKPKARAAGKKAAAKPKPAKAKRPAPEPEEPPAPVPEPADDANAAAAAGIEAPANSSLGESSLRVDIHVLDHLMNLVGELVQARNQIMRLAETSDDRDIHSASQRLHGVTSELQEAVMHTRMQPISLVWNKFPRFVRDVSKKFGKKVEIEMEGQDTELDKGVIEAIQGSLLHLVRNSLDHGIESPEERRAQGKKEVGILRLKALHEGGNVLIEVSDDGGGIDHDRVLKRGIKAGLVRADEADAMTPRQIESLIFSPGFSTAKAVTSISGRGVGLDIVRNNIEAIGGSVELSSELGMSTTFRLKIPLTLAIIPVLLVKSDDLQFAIPQISVVELVRSDERADDLGIEDLNGVPVYRLRGHLLPLLHLGSELGLSDADLSSAKATNIVVLQGDDRRFGLIVDSIEDSQEIVVKPLGPLIEHLPYAGTTILGNGDVALILDVLRLGLKAGVVSEARSHAAASRDEAELEDDTEVRTLLYIMGPADERLAIDFTHVDRLEFVAAAKIERVAGLPVVQYRNEILQLIYIDETLPERRKKVRKLADLPDLDALQVVVCSVGEHRVGLVVYRILDIVRHRLDITRDASREGIEMCVVIDDRVTEVIDIEALVRLADPGFFSRGKKKKKRVKS